MHENQMYCMPSNINNNNQNRGSITEIETLIILKQPQVTCIREIRIQVIQNSNV